MVAPTRPQKHPKPVPAGCVGERVGVLRRRQGWTQQQLADHAGLSLPTIKAVETGKDVYPSSLRALAEAFGIDLRTLLIPID